MAESRGKKFETIFRTDWLSYVSDSFCYRLYDIMSGFKGIAGVSDFICFKSPYLFLIDCKSHSGNTMGFADFRLYELMKLYEDITNLFAGTIIWFCDHDRVVWVPILTWDKLKEDGKKSFNVKYIDSKEYYCFEIPSKKKRVFMESNYSALIDEVENGRV